MVGGSAVADSASAHGEPASADASVAEDDFVTGLKFFWQGLGVDERGAGYGICGEECSAEGAGRAAKEVSP